MRRGLHVAMEEKGIRILCHEVFSKIERRRRRAADRAQLRPAKTLAADQVLLALGRGSQHRRARARGGRRQDRPQGRDPGRRVFSRTNVESIYAVGDVTDRVQLTPVAIHEAMCLIDTLYQDRPTSPDHDMIATAVFSQPEIGTVGAVGRRSFDAL